MKIKKLKEKTILFGIVALHLYGCLYGAMGNGRGGPPSPEAELFIPRSSSAAPFLPSPARPVSETREIKHYPWGVGIEPVPLPLDQLSREQHPSAEIAAWRIGQLFGNKTANLVVLQAVFETLTDVKVPLFRGISHAEVEEALNTVGV